MAFQDKLDSIIRRFDQLEQSMSSDEVISDPDRLRELAREHSNLLPIVDVARKYAKACAFLKENRALVKESDDRELVEMAEDEIVELETEIDGLEERLKELLTPKDPMDDKDCIIEIRAGTGGEEASLFAGDLLRMYSYYLESRGWKSEMLSASPSEKGGFKEVIVAVHGAGAYGSLKYESGVHRVQRVPVTESSGRIHTSAATVAVLPEAEDIDIDLDPSDLKIDVFRSSGPGGQSVNTTDSAVRITHLPTNLVVSCQDEKSQLKNKNKALKVLKSRLLDLEIQKANEQRAAERKSQVGTGDRSAKIRTYNFPQSRVTDHRIGLTLHKLEAVLEGDLVEILEALSLAAKNDKLTAPIE